ncbi:MAG: tRNA nucleotidyltransferase (CCA-adding enzyme) [Oceanicoccus sp.]|jgi:tRNA nucleotidyltransferase (CCA-adding enzyme)
MKTYLVGGAVRDKLLNYPFHERDWVVVGAHPEQLLSNGYQQVGKDFPVFLHPKTKEEYALARTERKTAPGYTGFSCHAGPDVSLEQDLLRRDLTINAIAEDSNGELIDPYNGQQDINAKILRHVSPAFSEDPLRVLRVARFFARYGHLGFTVAEETLHLMQKISASGELSALPKERVWKELERALGEKSPQNFFSLLQQCGALAELMPQLLPINTGSLAQIKTAAEQQQPTTIIYALACHIIDPAQAETLNRDIKAPKIFAELALLSSRFLQSCQQTFSDAQALLTLLEQLDPFRREPRFRLFLTTSELVYPANRTQQQLNASYQACAEINAAEFVRQGLTGKAIATAIKQQRLQAIEKLLHKIG